MIYIDTSVALAQLLAEDRRPPATLWSDSLVSSRLLEYETWTRLHAMRVARTHGTLARDLLGRVALVELLPTVLSRALDPFPAPVRTLDALHLATIEFLRAARQPVALATYDARLAAAAAKLGVTVLNL